MLVAVPSGVASLLPSTPVYTFALNFDEVPSFETKKICSLREFTLFPNIKLEPTFDIDEVNQNKG